MKNLEAVANEFGMSVEQFSQIARNQFHALPGQLPDRNFYEEQDEGTDGDVDLCLDLKAMRKSSAWKRIQRAAKFLDQSVKEFVTHSIMEMVRTCEEDMILSPRSGEPICDKAELEQLEDDRRNDWD